MRHGQAPAELLSGPAPRRSTPIRTTALPFVVPTIKRWLKRRHQTEDVNIHKIPGRPSVKGNALREWLPRHLEAKTLTLPQKSIAKPLRIRVT